ncbi:ABC transporter ATP-binding protein [Actinokineospora auranticolor]|uniref:ATP-binding cassette subfamily B protein n=1 Tax=Actinokineospora auranticolor TaxID=155976 RepID=A0A2S6GK37_9PSEU|nr:ABC transporter ATP-binding protein [Actinokineospora auranticolor]PPK65587.1 ATP-binding cassette subfamily B protein [Actinokineospora auranticolor]
MPDGEGGSEPLLAVERLSVPEWARLGEEVAATGFWRSTRAVPAVVARVAVLAWRASRALTAAAFAAHVLVGFLAAFGLLATAELFTALLAAGSTEHRLAAASPAVAAVVACYAGKALLGAAASAVEGSLRPLVTRAAERAVAESAVHAPLVAAEDADFQELARRAGTDGVESVDNGVRQVTGLATGLVSLVAALVSTAVLHPLLAAALLLAAGADGWAAHRVARLNRRHFLDTVTRQLVKGVVREAATARPFALERHALVLQDRLMAEYDRVTGELVVLETRLARRSALVRLVGRCVAGLGTAASFGVLALLLWTGVLPLAVAGTAVIAMRSASAALAESLRAVNLLHEDSHHLDLYRGFLAEAAARRTRVRPAPAPADPGVIRLAGVSFTYPGQDRPAVAEVDLTIRRGEVVALVGENGSGKTTLGKLITGLYPVSAGSVTWDGVDLATADPRSVHERVAVIAQTPAEWPVTAALAVRMGRLDHVDRDGARWRRALLLSGADEVVDALPHGARTLLSRRFREGRDLSGGQWQRLGIARGIYRDAPVLVADEPTAALDAKAEARVFEALRNACADGAGTTRTTILVTHRLANVRTADRVVVLAGGRIVAQGTHDELITAGGLYREMYETQASAYRDSGT